MLGSGKDITIDYTRTSWIQELKKAQLLQILHKLEIEYNANANIDELRRVLRAHVEEVNKQTVKHNRKDIEGENDNKPENIITHKMTDSNKIKLEFHLGKDDWEMYAERLELYFVANDVKEEKQAAVLLTKISPDTYKLVRDLCSPNKPSTKTFKELVKLINDHLNPKPSETMERCKFHKAQQTETETVAEYAARLKSLAITCNFGDVSTALRDQLVCGLKEHATKTLLFREDKLTFETAFRLATTVEAAEKNASSTDKRNPTAETTKEVVNKVQTKPGDRQIQSRRRGSYRGKRGNQRYDANQRTKGKQETSSNSTACYCCGKNNHWARDCYYRHRTCNTCQKKGHLSTVCRTRGSIQQLQRDAEGEEEPQEDYDFYAMTSGEKTSRKRSNVNMLADPMYLEVIINSKAIRMEIDTGSYVSVISKEDKDKYFPECNIEKSNVSLNAYGNVPLEQEGIISNLKVKLGKQSATLKMRVMKGNGPILLGRQWLKALGVWPLKINKKIMDCNKVNLNTTRDFTTRFSKLFGKGPGCYKKGMLKLRIKEDAKPVALKARHLPFALAGKVEDELNRLVSLGHLEKIDVSEWATPVVPVIKANGSVRICGNFKLTVNPCLVKDRHPIPLIDEIFRALRGGKTFSQIDLQHAYMQIPVEESSRDYLTIITHKGLYRYTKMPEGIASGPGDFQRKIEQCIAGIEGVIAYLDNIYCTGKDDEEHMEALYATFERLEQCGFHVNVNKCEFFKEKLDILGFVIDKGGLHKSQTKVKAMTHAPIPQGKKQLESFIGLITYYARFLPGRAEKLKPLYDCAKLQTFKWTADCQKAFEWVKKELVSPRVLVHYDASEELILSCDASTYGLGAILSHRYKDGTEKPIAFASKVIPESELSRAIIDKEASAIVFGFKKFYNYVYGREITLRTDHKPLVYIFGTKQEIPLTVASRLQRWAYFVSRFTYKIEYIKSQENGNCDALSRLPINDSTPIFDNEFTAINYVAEALDTITATEIAKETKKNKQLSSIIRYINDAWPTVSEMNEYEKKFYTKREELCVDKGCLLWGYRIVVPNSMKHRVLSELHASHFGVVKMKMLARNYVWWPNIDKDIENVAAECKVCVQERKKPGNVPLNPWPYPDHCWSRIHIDFLGPFHGHIFMIIIDAYSKWAEVVDMNKCTTVPRVLEEFKKVLVRFGLPKHLVTDNGTQFTSKEFREFCTSNGIKQSFTAPHHPATNGAAENFVGIFKNKVDKMVQSGKPLGYAVNLFLFDYRSIEHCTTGRSPAFMMYKREIRTRFDLIKPSVTDHVEKRQLAQVGSTRGNRNVEFHIGDTVMVDDFRVRSNKRVTGTIIKKLSPVTFQVKIAPDKIWKRHVDQIVRFRAATDATGTAVPAGKSDVVLRRSERLREK